MKVGQNNSLQLLVCSEGKTRKIFGEKGNYYQSLYALWILSEAMWKLFWKAFLTWAEEKDTTLSIDGITTLVKVLMWNKGNVLNKLDQISKDASLHILSLQEQLEEFQKKSLEVYPTAVFCMEFLQMCDILHRFNGYEAIGLAT